MSGLTTLCTVFTVSS